MGITETLARFAVETPAGFMNEAMKDSARMKFLDTIGIMVAGARHPSGKIAISLARKLGGKKQATLCGTSSQTSVELAAFVNGVSAHALEYDDYTRSVGHASVCLVPGCLAIAEAEGKSGLAMLEAFTLGFEVTTRIARGLRPKLINNGWHPIGIVGGQGVAVAAARMMGMDQMKTRMAMGVMASSGGGVRKNVGSMGKAFHVGHGVKSGVLAALLAREGFIVDPDIIEGMDDVGEGHQRFGMADTFNGIGEYRLHLMTDNLGQDLELGRNTTMIRMHPGSTAPGAAIDGVIAIATESNLTAADVKEIIVECTPQCAAIAPYPEPTNEHRAKFCLPYTMSVAFLDRRVGLAQYSDKRIKDKKTLKFMERITIQQPQDLSHHRGQWGENGVNWAESRVTIKLKSGEEIRKTCSHSKGYPEDPVSWDELMIKYQECTERAFAKSQIEETAQMIRGIDTLGNVRELAKALIARPKTATR
jgi:2-methylcitrate dehydratase PrpD